MYYMRKNNSEGRIEEVGEKGKDRWGGWVECSFIQDLGHIGCFVTKPQDSITCRVKCVQHC